MSARSCWWRAMSRRSDQPAGMPSPGSVMRRISNVGYRLAVFATVMAVGAPAESVRADLWQFIFGLSGDNTAYDYMSAPISRAVNWEMHTCDAGECLYRSDWLCGFENNDDENKVIECFSNLVDRVQPWVKLDVLRKYCGVLLARFTGNETLGLHFQIANPQQCAEAGGVWGERSPVSIPGGRP